MNKVILMGRLTKDPDIRWTQGQNQTCVARYTLAVDRRTTNAQGQREADFLPCVAFGKNAEFAEKWLHKGIKIVIIGHLQTGSYTNREGQKVYTTDVMIEASEFAESAQKAQEGTQNAQTGGNWNNDTGFVNEGFMSIPEGADDAGLPFN